MNDIYNIVRFSSHEYEDRLMFEYLGDICEGFKAPRAHHCKKCGRCMLKLDHHVSEIRRERMKSIIDQF